MREEYSDRQLRALAESKLPSEAEMRALASANPPPQSWHDEDFGDL